MTIKSIRKSWQINKGLKNKARMTREYLYYKLEQFERIKQEIEDLRREVDD